MYLLTFKSFRRYSADVLSVETAVFPSKVINFPRKFIVHGHVYEKIEYQNFNALFLLKLQSGVRATRVHAFMKL